MAEEERPTDEDAPAEAAPSEDTSADDAPPAADQAAEEAAPEGTSEPAAEAEDAPKAEEAQASEEAEGETAEPKPKAKDAPPGAELEPIAIEPERELSAEERARAEAEAEERASRDAAADDAGAEEPLARRGPTVELPADTRIQATGKRKTAIARVVLAPGGGVFEVNSRKLEEYFPRHQHQTMARQALVTAGYEDTVDVRVRVHGGGISGQAGAVRHGVARALTEIDPELRGELKRRGYLTRDAREKERRKAGLKKARKRPQFSKR